MGWLSNVIGKVHNITKYIDPADHWVMEATHYIAPRLVNETSKLIGDVGGKSFIGDLGRTGEALSERDKGDFNGWLSRTATSAASWYAGTAASEAIGAGSATGEVARSGGTYYEAGTGAVDLGQYAGQSGSIYSEAGSAADAAKYGKETTPWWQDPSVKQVAGSLATQALSKAAAGKQGPSESPQVRPVSAMPDPKAQAAARRRKLAEQLARRGRASSILTGGG